MLKCNDCGFERPMLNSLLGTPHGPHCVGSWLEVPDRVYSGGNTSAANTIRVAEEAMRNIRALDAQRVARQNQDINQIQQMPSAMLIRPDDVAKWELFNAGAIDLAVQTELQGELKSRLDLAGENQRLKMEVADLRGQLVDHEAKAELQAAEFRFCSREIRRTNPRLAKARWGK